MNTTLRKILLISLLLLVLNLTAIGQPPPPPPEDIPIDGGLLFLLGSGFAYVAKKFFSKEK